METHLIPPYALAANLFIPEEGASIRGAALFIHGWQSAQDRMFDLAESLRVKGFVCLTFDMRAHGNTAGDIETFSRKDFFDDVLAAYDFLVRQPGVNADSVAVIGSSFGGYLAALLTASRPVAQVVMRVPADYTDDRYTTPKVHVEKAGAMEWRARMKSWEETAALRALHAFDGRVLIVESEHDVIVPPGTLQSYRAALRRPEQCTYFIMRQAAHSLSKHPEQRAEFNQLVHRWLCKAD